MRACESDLKNTYHTSALQQFLSQGHCVALDKLLRLFDPSFTHMPSTDIHNIFPSGLVVRVHELNQDVLRTVLAVIVHTCTSPYTRPIHPVDARGPGCLTVTVPVEGTWLSDPQYSTCSHRRPAPTKAPP